MADYTELTPTIVLRLRYAFLLDNAENVSEEMNRIAKLIDWDEYDGNATFNEVLQEYLDEGRGDIDDFSHWYNEIVKDDEDYDNDDCDDEDCDDPWNTCPNNHFGLVTNIAAGLTVVITKMPKTIITTTTPRTSTYTSNKFSEHKKSQILITVFGFFVPKKSTQLQCRGCRGTKVGCANASRHNKGVRLSFRATVEVQCETNNQLALFFFGITKRKQKTNV
jgi:hypothetical protein